MDTGSRAHRLGIREILRRLQVPLLLFSLSFAVLLALSWLLLLPRLTRVEIGGSVRGLTELRTYRDRLQAQISDLQDRRRSALLPLGATDYGGLVSAKHDRPSFESLLDGLRAAASETAGQPDGGLMGGDGSAIRFSVFYYDATGGALSVRGRVQNVGPRSMTVLAQFIEALKANPSFTRVDGVRFVREEDSAGGFVSPFNLSFSLRE